MKNLGGLSKLVKHALLLLLVTSPIFSAGKRLPTGRHRLTEEADFGDGDHHRSDSESSESDTTEEVTEETRQDGEEGGGDGNGDGDDMAEVAMVARHVVHASDMVAVNYIWVETEGAAPESKMFVAPMSDGHKESGRGSPYFYASRNKWGLENVTKVSLKLWWHGSTSPQCSPPREPNQAATVCTVFAWRSDAGSCDYARLPIIQDKCEHVVLLGYFEEIDRSSAEYEYALPDFFSRHESYLDSKPDDAYFLVKFIITGITVFYKTDEPIDLPVDQYYDVAATVSSSAPDFGNSFAVKSLLSLTVFLKFFKIFT